MEWKEIFWNNKMKRLKNKFISATDFSRGKAIVKPFGCDENFCINKNGEILFKTQFHTFGHFNEFDQIIIYIFIFWITEAKLLFHANTIIFISDRTVTL